MEQRKAECKQLPMPNRTVPNRPGTSVPTAGNRLPTCWEHCSQPVGKQISCQLHTDGEGLHNGRIPHCRNIRNRQTAVESIVAVPASKAAPHADSGSKCLFHRHCAGSLHHKRCERIRMQPVRFQPSEILGMTAFPVPVVRQSYRFPCHRAGCAPTDSEYTLSSFCIRPGSRKPSLQGFFDVLFP